MIEIYFKPETELEVFDYISQINGCGCHQADLIVSSVIHPGLVAKLFDKIRDINWELEGVSLNYDRFGHFLISLKKKHI